MAETEDIYLINPYEKFKSEVDELIKESARLYKSSVNNEEELEDYKGKIESWIERSLSKLQSSFNVSDNQYANEFRYANPNFYRVPGQQQSLDQKVKQHKERIIEKQKSLWGTLRVLSVSDVIIYPDKFSRSKRAEYSVEEILSLLLDKLYQLYDDFYYSVTDILVGNGIVLKRFDDDMNWAQMLENSGYIEIYGAGDGVSARITAQGAMIVEEGKKSIKSNYDQIPNSPEELENKLNEIFDRLRSLGYGQEVIFNELEELRELNKKLTKKEWGQILKGKLVDLSLAKLVENDTIKYIYEVLTDQKLHLP